MHLDPLLPLLVEIALVVLVVGVLLRLLKQPYVIAYLIAGVLLGPHGFGTVTDQEAMTHLGAIGVVLLLFFVGMEISLPKLIINWRVALIGTLFQILVSVGIVWLVGSRLGWPLERSILLGFVISLSSTAVVFKILEEWKEMDTRVGQNAIAVLLVQDLAIVPMLITLRFLGGETIDRGALLLQTLGGAAAIGAIVWLIVKVGVRLPFGGLIRRDHELQVFAALILCLGLALLTGLAGLSTALGAFVAGLVVSSARETHWVHTSLEPFRVVFLALFFVSVGMLIDLPFLRQHWLVAALLIAVVLLLNTVINTVILRLLGDTWRESLYTGGLLSQIGEFSFLLGAVGFQSGIITEYAYQMTIAIIALTLLFSPAWIHLIKTFTVAGNRHHHNPQEV